MPCFADNLDPSLWIFHFCCWNIDTKAYLPQMLFVICNLQFFPSYVIAFCSEGQDQGEEGIVMSFLDSWLSWDTRLSWKFILMSNNLALVWQYKQLKNWDVGCLTAQGVFFFFKFLMNLRLRTYGDYWVAFILTNGCDRAQFLELSCLEGNDAMFSLFR